MIDYYIQNLKKLDEVLKGDVVENELKVIRQDI